MRPAQRRISTKEVEGADAVKLGIRNEALHQHALRLAKAGFKWLSATYRDRSARPIRPKYCSQHPSWTVNEFGDCTLCLADKPDEAREKHSRSMALALEDRPKRGRPRKAPSEFSLDPLKYTYLAMAYPDEDRALAWKVVQDLCRRASESIHNPEAWLRKGLRLELPKLRRMESLALAEGSAESVSREMSALAETANDAEDAAIDPERPPVDLTAEDLFYLGKSDEPPATDD